MSASVAVYGRFLRNRRPVCETGTTPSPRSTAHNRESCSNAFQLEAGKKILRNQVGRSLGNLFSETWVVESDS